MKKAGVFATFLAAASCAALAAASPNPRASSSSSKEVRLSSPLHHRYGSSRKGNAGSGPRKDMEDKFTPRFDRLRFIETLVTVHRGKSRIMSSIGPSFGWSKLILYGAKDEESFEAHTPYLGEIFDRGTKTTQLVEAKLGSKCLVTGQEDVKASTLEEYTIVLSFELSQKKQCAAKIMLGAKAQDPDNGAPISSKSVDFGSC
ncbi:hypothetical protein C4D60_Mb02t10380 [Musa balbisiana]|uniref:Uncharacterized protein n=1 Tax=Musa balbisiana TaxID=52838 RepID=A0A4S8I9P6_MUSBA|nr:hypothetical protein C4D60_Mb02t10380 [Musa balbisiana]